MLGGVNARAASRNSKVGRSRDQRGLQHFCYLHLNVTPHIAIDTISVYQWSGLIRLYKNTTVESTLPPSGQEPNLNDVTSVCIPKRGRTLIKLKCLSKKTKLPVSGSCYRSLTPYHLATVYD